MPSRFAPPWVVRMKGEGMGGGRRAQPGTPGLLALPYCHLCQQILLDPFGNRQFLGEGSQWRGHTHAHTRGIGDNFYFHLMGILSHQKSQSEGQDGAS